MPPRGQTYFIPPPPSPEVIPRSPSGHVSPPVIPPTSATLPNWARTEHQQQVPDGYPMSPVYAHAPYAAATTIPGAPPGSYFIPPVALPHAGSTPTAPVGANGFSANYTGFPDYPTTPHSAGFSPHPVASPAAAQSPWIQASMYGMAMPPVPGTQYSAFQQPLPYGYPPWPTPGMHPAAMGAMGGAYAPPMTVPGGWGHTPYGPQPGLPPGFHTQPPAPRPPPPTENPRAQHPEYKQQYDLAAQCDKWSEEVQYGPVLEAFIIKRVEAKLELNPLLMPTPDDLQSHPWLIWDMRFPTSQCQRGPVKSNRSWAEGRLSPATWPRTKTLRVVSKTFPWMVEIQASEPDVGVTCADIIDGLHEFLYARCTDAEYKKATREMRSIIYEWFNRNRSVEDGAPGGRIPQTLLRCDWLGELNQWGGLVHDSKQVKEICGAEIPCTFVLQCTLKHSRSSNEEIREQEARLATADAARERRSRSQTRSRATSRAPSRAASRPREPFLDNLSHD